jgi:phage-related baseplate assembly protein
MDNTELHYVSFDPEEIWKEMMLAYIEAGGDLLYPGDEKEMLLRSVQAVVTQVFAGIDAGLRMQTLRYAAGEYLDLIGENRNCLRIQASPAVSEVEITFIATGKSDVLAAGRAMTADGVNFYELAEDLAYSGLAQVSRAAVVCRQAGSAGNGLYAGAQMGLAISHEAAVSVMVTRDASGGNDAEDDESYRERIRLYGLASITTGPASQYKAAAMNVSSEILDAKAVNEGAGMVGVYLIIRDGEGHEAIVADVEAALNSDYVRPLTDTLTVSEADEVPYALVVKYKSPSGTDITQAVSRVIEEYSEWQDNSIGRAFNPDRLMASVYQAGAERVIWGEGSAFDGGTVEYTEIEANERCKGVISMEAMIP